MFCNQMFSNQMFSPSFQVAPDGKQHLYLNEGKERLKELEGATVHFPGGPSLSPLLLSFLVLERPESMYCLCQVVDQH
jgi:hypothetical protein